MPLCHQVCPLCAPCVPLLPCGVALGGCPVQRGHGGLGEEGLLVDGSVEVRLKPLVAWGGKGRELVMADVGEKE